MTFSRLFYGLAVATILSGTLAACKSDATDASATGMETTAEGGISPEDQALLDAAGPEVTETRPPEEVIAELNAGGRAGSLPALPQARVEELRQQVTKIDLVFFTQGVSMSLDNPQAVSYALNAVSPEQAQRRPKCQPIARMFMTAGKESVAEADVFFTNGCTYFEVFENKKPSYANMMTPEGKAFFNDNLKQAIPDFKVVK